MCGIAGFINRHGEPADAELLRAMTGILAHRGPDGDGFWIEGPVALGHRRLAIIDLGTGAQPMTNDGATGWITYNGELYNFRELRADLERQGFVFRTTSDTEVVLQAYLAHGVDCVRHFRGMFAFAIWDAPRRRLFLARDRVGIKPLVYAWDDRRLRFASELKSILQDPTVPRDLDWEAFRDYLTLSYVPSPRTIFRAIRKLPPASYLVLDPDRDPEIQRYWDIRFAPDRSRARADWVAELRWRLADAVQSHLVSDVPVGAFLSGGIDSSAVVALMAQADPRPVRTFSIGFDDAEYDELRYARLVAQRHATDHYEFVVKPNAMEVWPKLAWQFDEPFGDSSALPTYFVSKLTRDHVTVALSGDGGDENFAGYGRYAWALALHRRLDRLPGLLLRPLLRLAAGVLPAEARGQGWVARLAADPIGRYLRSVTVHRPETVGHLLGPAARPLVARGLEAGLFRHLIETAPPPDYVSALQYLDMRTYLPEDILVKVDRTSMLVSLEARVPLLDHRLMEFVATMPSELKLSGGRGKAILREAIAPDLPGEILQRRKMGFGVPLRAWFRGELATYAHDLLSSRRARERGLFDPRTVERLLAEHRRGARDRASQLWSLLCVEAWACQWADR
jgi:asparagine synthase (glutamine-hydrolysing)